MIKTFLQLILLPFSILYGIILEVRNKFYDWKIFKIYSFDVPVISVGNVSVGGSGKTPFTIFLTQKLQSNFPNIAVVSRGYGRKSRGLQVVSDGKQLLINPEMAGDEPYLIARCAPEIVVAVGEQRREAIEYVIKKFPVDLIILDDAFQHRAVERDMDIVLINAKEKAKLNLPLPAGRLREFKHNLRRANLIIATNVDGNEQTDLRWRLDFSVQSQLNKLINLEFKEVGKIGSLSGQRVVAFAGIAHPQNFHAALKREGINVIFFKEFSDHYHYSVRDWDRLQNIAQTRNCQVLLCTEKDLVKISNLGIEGQSLLKQELQLYAVSLQLIVDDEKKLLEIIQQHVDKKR